ncbi:MAG: RloB family protein [bacterium]
MLLVVCEGERTEPDYFRHVKARLRLSAAEIESEPNASAPSSVVSFAKARLRHHRSKGIADVEVWCVIDRDTHTQQDFESAVSDAIKSGFQVACSIPCFEVWLLAHFAAPGQSVLSCSDFKDRLGQHAQDFRTPGVSAHTFGLLSSTESRAMDWALSQESRIEEAIAQQTTHVCTPATQVHRLIQRMAELKAQTPPFTR